jgi:glycine/D-amino acid oxidase-like deaminating enzyme
MDVVVIGGGIIGCTAAAELAAAGARVTLFEENAIGAGASGRNLGALQHPFDDDLLGLHMKTLAIYRDLAAESDGFSVPIDPAGLLLLQTDPAAARRQAERLGRAFGDLAPTALDPTAVHELEPALAPGPAGVLLATGYPIPPAAATDAMAARARRLGAEILTGAGARLAVDRGRVVGVVLSDGQRVAADAVLVAAGPWTPGIVDPTGAWEPIHRTWGVTVQLRLGIATPRHVIEEDEVDAINRSAAATSRAADVTEADEPPSLFSIAAADGVSTLGSTFIPDKPDPEWIVPLLVRRGAEFLPAIAHAPMVTRRMCARPQSVDGRPFIGAVPWMDGLFVCAGHGPWGISIGPASAALVARAILDRHHPIPESFAVGRVQPR